MLLGLADTLAEDNRVQLDAVVCQLPSLATDRLDVLRQGLEILFERAGPAMVVDKETFLEAMATGQLTARGGKASVPQVGGFARSDGRRAGRSARSDRSDEDGPSGFRPAPRPEQSARSDRSDEDGYPADEESRYTRDSVDTRCTVTIPRAAPAYPGAYLAGRRKTTQMLEDEIRGKEMRECTFAPKTNKYPARGAPPLKWGKAGDPDHAPPRPRSAVPRCAPAPAEAGGLLPAKGRDRASRRTQRVREMLDERLDAEQKECTFAPKINPAPRPSSAGGPKPDQSLRGGVRPRFKWQESLRGGPGTAQPASREDIGSQLVGRSFFDPPRGDGDGSSRCSSEERDQTGRGPPRTRSDGFSHQVVLRDA